MTAPPPKLVLDGAEGIEGRALLLISALRHGAARFTAAEIVMTAREPEVMAAIALLRWETGLDVGVEPDTARALHGARLFAAVAFRDTVHLPLAAVAAGGVPSMVAIQFPDLSRHGAAALALQRAAHDPALLADAITSALWPG